MNRQVLLGVMLAMLLLIGCAGGATQSVAPGSTADTGTAAPTDVSADPKTRGVATYAALTPEGALEKRAISSVGLTYRAYLESTEMNAKSDPDAVVYRDGDKVAPQFIGYEITAASDRLDNGSYNMSNLMVLNGVVTSAAAWDKAGEMTMEDIRPEYFVYEVPSDYRQPLEAETDRQKGVLDKAEAWMTTNFSDKKLTRFELTALVFAYGQPADEHYLLLSMNPDSPSSFGASAR